MVFVSVGGEHDRVARMRIERDDGEAHVSWSMAPGATRDA
jgi:hypothetical protein